MQLKINNFSYDDSNGLVVKSVEEYKLTKIQRKLFNYFINHPNTTISKQTLMDEVWGRTVTENSIEKTLSKLRNVIEDNPLNPKILITHHGHGISFEGKIVRNQEKNDTNQDLGVDTKVKRKFSFILPVLILVAGIVWFVFKQNTHESKPYPIEHLNKNQRLLMLPMVFDENTNAADAKNINKLIKSTFNNLNSEGKVLFDDISQSANEALNKNWQIDNDLVMMQTRVKKHGEVYDAVIEITKGLKTVKTVKISAGSLIELSNAQNQFVANFHKGVGELFINNVDAEQLMQVKHYYDSKNWLKSKQILDDVLQNNDKNYQARLMLSQVYTQLSQYDKSLLQLKTLISTPFYKNNSAVIHMNIAQNYMFKNKFTQSVDELTGFLSQNQNVGELKKAKINIILADSYSYLGNAVDSLKFYKQAILNINDKLFPRLFAQSYYGQAKLLNNTSTGDDVYKLFEKSLYYAKLAHDIKDQAQILDSMSVLLFFNNQWQKGLDLKRQSISLMEINDDKSVAMGTGLGVLASYLIERGLFTEAREVIDRIATIAREIKSDHITLIYNFYDISLELNFNNFDYCQKELDKASALAKKTSNMGMLLNNVFLQMEILVARKDKVNFEAVWREKNKLFQNPGLERYQIYMDLYLARFYQQIHNNNEAIALINKISEQAKVSSDFKFYVDAQNVMAKIYQDSDPDKALEILTNIEQYNPNPNPYLEIKAQVLSNLGKKVEALAIMLEAKEAYNEAWKAENQGLLEQLQQ